MTSEMEKTLRKATGVKPGKDEDRQDYLKRLVSAVLHDDFDEDKWNAFDAATQTYVNAAGKAIKAGDAIDDFPTEDEETEGDAEATDAKAEGADEQGEPEAKEKKVKAKTKVKAKAKPADEKPAPEKKAKAAAAPRKEPKARPAGSQQAIKKAILKQPKISVEDIMAKLEKQGYKPSRMAVSSIRSGFRDSLKVIKDAGVDPSGLEL